MDGRGGGRVPHGRNLSWNIVPVRTKNYFGNGSFDGWRWSFPVRSPTVSERTVKRFCYRKALTMPENTTVHEACHRMAARRVDCVLLTDSNALLCGILTDKDITRRAIAHELKLEEIPVSQVMTQNPVFVHSNTLAVEALQKMVQGKFRHLPVVENCKVIALLDIAKCLYDAIARMERAGPNSFIETLREQMSRPTLSTIIPENPRVVAVSPIDSVLTAVKKMLELKMSSAIVIAENKTQGILTSRDILMRVISQNLSPESTPVEKVMTPNPECGTVDTPIIDALHIMHDGKFLHLPVVDRDGQVISVMDVIHITHAAITTMGSSGVTGNEATTAILPKFWDSTMAIGPADDYDDSQSERFSKMTSETTDAGRNTFVPALGLTTTFGFKLQDRKGRMHRFICETRNLADLITCIVQRAGDDIDRNHLPQILYEDEDRDKIILASNNDLAVAVDHARQAGWKSLRLHLDYSGSDHWQKGREPRGLDHALRDAWSAAYSAVTAGAALVAGFGVMAYLKRSGS